MDGCCRTSESFKAFCLGCQEPTVPLYLRKGRTEMAGAQGKEEVEMSQKGAELDCEAKYPCVL